MKGHKAVAFERGTYGHDGRQKGYAARCETCGAVTFGGFRTKTDAKGALEHTRAIAPIVGVDKDTVRRDLQGGVFTPPEPVQGMDGKTYTRPEVGD